MVEKFILIFKSTIPRNFQLKLLSILVRFDRLAIRILPGKWRFNPNKFIGSYLNSETVEVFISLVDFDFPFIQRPQQMATHSAQKANGRDVLFVEVSSVRLLPKVVSIAEGSITLVSLSHWIMMRNHLAYMGKKVRIFFPAHSADVKADWLPSEEYWSSEVQIIADLFDFPSYELDGKHFDEKRVELQERLTSHQSVKWICCSELLMDYISNVSENRKILIPNAAPTKVTHIFSEQIKEKTSRHSESSKIIDLFESNILKSSSEIAIFSGVFGSWVDRNVLNQLIGRQPNWLFIVVGPKYLGDHPEFPQPNVLQFDSLPYSDVTKLLKISTIGLLPFDNSVVSNAASPLKLYEYLDAELIVLTSNLNFVINSKCVLLEPMTTKSEIDKSVERARSINSTKLDNWFDVVTKFHLGLG